MIKKALRFTNDSLDQYLKNRFGLDEGKVHLNTIINPDGSIPQINQNKVVISLINIEKETLRPFYSHNQKLSNGQFSDVNPSEKYNLDILLTSNFDDYDETLKFLNSAIQFFQVNNVMDSNTSSVFTSELTKLEYEIEKISYHEMHNLWSAMGAKYQPSVIYKVRLITIQANETEGFVTAVNQTSNTVES